MSHITILIPTLNEESNVDALLGRILSVKESSGLDFSILFVDSASQDKTCARILSWEKDNDVNLLKREVNVGLAGAVIAGAGHCRSKYLLVMDADLSHPPEKIPLLLEPLLNETCDMVIGSRYVAGGSTPDWPFSRKLASRLATLPARVFCDVYDPLAGFFAVKRKYFDLLPSKVPGFKIALALLAESGNSMRVKEVPIEFRDRDSGESKMGKRVILEYLMQLASITGRRFRS